MDEILDKLGRLQKAGFAAGAVLLVLCGVGAALNPGAFFVSWLVAFLFWMGLALGCFNAAMIHYLTGGRWGFATRRFLEAGFMTLPVMAVLFVPLLFGLNDLYPWARPGAVVADKILRHRAAYEDAGGFMVRAVFCFSIWLLLAWRLRRWSLQQDATADVAPTIKIRTWSGPAVVIVPLTTTFALVDWAMSIEPKWFSTVFPVILLSGQVLAAFAFVILVLRWLQPDELFGEAGREKQFHDLGNLLLAFVLFWTYVSFAQILIIYSANLPQEIGWYLRRIAGDWKGVLIVVALFHFLVPFLLLLFRPIKRFPHRLAAVAGLVFALQAVNLFWVVAPTFYPRVEVHWTDFAAWFGMGGIWLGVFAGNLKRHPLIAKNDPRQEHAPALIADAN